MNLKLRAVLKFVSDDVYKYKIIELSKSEYNVLVHLNFYYILT